MSQAAPTKGMVDHLDSSGAGPSQAEIEFATAYLQPGPMDPAILARLSDPARVAAREELEARRRAHDWAQIGQYRNANAALAGLPAPEAVFIGSSITEMWTMADPELFSDGIVGRGIRGQTSPQLLVRFMPDVVALRPAIVHLLGGVNDIAGNTGPSTPQDYQNNIRAMAALAQAHGITMILGSILPCAQYRQRVAQLNAWLQAFAQDQQLVWADYHSVLAGPDGAMRPGLARDGLHPVREGYALMRPVAETALAEARQRHAQSRNTTVSTS